MNLKPLLVFLVAALWTYGAEIKVTGAGNFSVFLTSETDPGFEQRHPDNYVEAGEKEPFRWGGLKKGKYRIRISPDMESFAPMCIVSVPVDLDQDVKEVRIVVPAGRSEFQISFDKVRPSIQGELKHHVFRVQRVLEDGTLDPNLVQWLWTTKVEGKFTGGLSFLSPGKWRITAFDYQPGEDTRDVGFADVNLTKKDTGRGKVSVVINKPVEQDADEPATAPDSKLESKEKPNPASEECPR